MHQYNVVENCIERMGKDEIDRKLRFRQRTGKRRRRGRVLAPEKNGRANLDTESEHESDDDIQIVPEKVELRKKQKQSQITDFFRS